MNSLSRALDLGIKMMQNRSAVVHQQTFPLRDSSLSNPTVPTSWLWKKVRQTRTCAAARIKNGPARCGREATPVLNCFRDIFRDISYRWARELAGEK